MRISLGADHGGFILKNAITEVLKKEGYVVNDYGVFDDARVDYPDYAIKVALDVNAGRADYGVLVCTTGIGMSITANKISGVRAAVVSSLDAAALTRKHNNSNIICLGQKYTTIQQGIEEVLLFLNTEFEGGRHEIRVRKISDLEGK